MAGQQQEEIETIRSRTIEVKLSDADVKRISEKAAAHGLTVGELIENFIGDLVCGTYSNGSDERMYAEQWFERCWFGMFPDLTFLRYLIEWGGLDEVIGAWEKSVVTIHFFILQEVHKLSVLHYAVLSYECLQGLFYLRDLGACQLREVRNIKAVDGLNLSLIILSFLWIVLMREVSVIPSHLFQSLRYRLIKAVCQSLDHIVGSRSTICQYDMIVWLLWCIVWVHVLVMQWADCTLQSSFLELFSPISRS